MFGASPCTSSCSNQCVDGGQFEQVGDDAEPGWLAEAVTAAAGAGLALAAPGAEGALVGAVLPVALMAAYRLDLRAVALRRDRVARTVTRAAEELEVDIGELELRVAATPLGVELAARVFAASANAATARAKVEALGVVLATGLRDDAKFDEAFVLAAALGDLEAPHVRVLAQMAIVVRQTSGDLSWGDPLPRFHGGDRTHEDVAAAAGGELVAPAVVAALTRHGLLVAGQDRPDQMHLLAGAQGAAPVEPTYKVSHLGVACLRLLMPEVPPERQDSR